MVVTEALARGTPGARDGRRTGCPRRSAGRPTAACPGLLVPPDDPAALAGALRRWLGEPHLRHHLRTLGPYASKDADGLGRDGEAHLDRPFRSFDEGERPSMTAVPVRDVLLAGSVHVSSTWLDVREAADAAARSRALVPLVRRQLAGRSRVVIHDLGSGTGSMARWLAPQLPGPQHWILYDHDPDLLEHCAAEVVGRAADGAPVTVETRLVRRHHADRG